MNSRLLTVSLGLNLVLLGVAGFRAARSNSAGTTPAASAPMHYTNQLPEGRFEVTPPPAMAEASGPLRWNELESEDYATYAGNLRKTGCPEPVMRRIIGGELKELYARKAFALAQEFHRDFWKIATRENIEKYFEEKIGPEIKSLSKESDALLQQFVGETARELSDVPEAGARESGWIDFLSPDKQQQLRLLAERHEARRQAVRRSDLSPREKALQLEQSGRQLEREQARIFSPEEWTEYRLRQCAVTQLQQLHGVDFSETELRNLAKTIDDYNRRAAGDAGNASETLEQKLQAALGPERFADFHRASSASYRELYEVASDFGRPGETAAELFDLRLESEKQSDEIRADLNRPAEEKQALLDALHEKVEQTAITKFGPDAYQSYKTRYGRWINSLGRL